MTTISVIDSRMSRDEALRGVRPDCPEEVLSRQVVLSVLYRGFDSLLHEGQVVVDCSLCEDVSALFCYLLAQSFPLNSVIPVAAPQFCAPSVGWDDHLSMAANNSSSFNYRELVGTTETGLSLHGLGLALDLNPLTNPVYGYTSKKEVAVHPQGQTQRSATTPRPEDPGALWSAHPVVSFLETRGWRWGGKWTLEKEGIVDLHHFEKVPEDFPLHLKKLLAPVVKKNWLLKDTLAT